MHFIVHRDTKLLDSTGYIEIGPGRYSGQHWQEGFLFLAEDDFSIMKGIFLAHLPDFDHYGMNDIPRQTGLAIAHELRSVANVIMNENLHKVTTALHVNSRLLESHVQALSSHPREIQQMLLVVSTMLEQTYQTEDFVCVLGL